MWSLVAVLLTGTGFAQDTSSDEAKALYDQGLRYYQDQDFATAIELWERSYAVTPLPAILHNIAKAQEEDNLPREALVTWQAYYAVAPPEGRAPAEERIAALEIVVAALGEMERPAVPLPEPIPSEPPRERRSQRGLWAGLLAVGATGGVVGGSILAGQARSSGTALAQDGCVVSVNGSTLCKDPTATALRGEQVQFVIGAVIIGGGIALGGGSVLVALRPSASDVNVAVVGRW